MHSVCAQVLKKIQTYKIAHAHTRTLSSTSILTHIHIDNGRNQETSQTFDLYLDCPKLCIKNLVRGEMSEWPMAWSGIEECHRWGEFGVSLQGWDSSPDCGVLSSAGKEASHEQIGLSVLVVGRGPTGRRERKRVRAWLRQPAQAQEAAFPGGRSPSGALESGVR